MQILSTTFFPCQSYRDFPSRRGIKPVDYPREADAIRTRIISPLTAGRMGEIINVLKVRLSVPMLTLVSPLVGRAKLTDGPELVAFMQYCGLRSLEEAEKDRGYPSVQEKAIKAGEAVVKKFLAQGDPVVALDTFDSRQFHRLHTSEVLDCPSEETRMAVEVLVIEKLATKLVLRKGWELSTDSQKKYLIATMMQMGHTERQQIAIVDEEDKPIPLHTGMSLVVSAAFEFTNRGLDTASVKEVIVALKNAELKYRDDLDKALYDLLFKKPLPEHFEGPLRSRLNDLFVTISNHKNRGPLTCSLLDYLKDYFYYQREHTALIPHLLEHLKANLPEHLKTPLEYDRVKIEHDNNYFHKFNNTL